MRNFSKKLAFVLAAAMVFTAFAPAAKAKAASEMTINRASQTLYVNEGVNDKGSETLADGLYGNVQEYDFYVKNKPSDYAKTLKFVWTSSDEKVATVDQKGLTKAVGVGTATITCTITEKATGNKLVAAPTTKVTVKANASEITLTNAEDFEDQAFKAGAEIKFEYKMAAKDGGKATDKVKWIAEPATGVTVKDGVFTFGEDALPGEYTLYAETYQSEKYTATTATSNKVTVTYVADNNVEIKQDNATQFTVKFDNAVKAFSVDDVSMIKRVEVAAGTFDYAMPVKAVELAKDGLSAKVTLYNTLTHNSKYIISVNGYEDYELTASLGNPTRMELYAQDADLGVILTTGVGAPLGVKFYDEKDVEVTPANPTIVYRLETRATDGSYYLAGNKLTIKKEGIIVKVTADYQGRVENGKRVGQLTANQEFFAVEAQPTQVGSIVEATINNDWNKPTLTMRPGQNGEKQVQIKFATSDGKKTDALTNGSTFVVGGVTYKVSMTSATPQYAVVTSSGYLTAFKSDVVAEFYVNLQERKANGSYGDAYPVDFLYVTVDPDAKFANTELSTYSLTLGDSDVDESFYKGKVTLTAKDTYGDAMTITSGVAVECSTDGYEKDAFEDAISVAYVDGKAEITVDALDIISILDEDAPEDGEAVMLYFSTTYEKYTEEFYVLVQTAGQGDNYVQIKASTDSIDALRIKEDNPWNAKLAKDISFEVFWMNNGVQVDKLALNTYPTKASDLSDGDYCFKVTKDDKTVDAGLAGNKVTIALSYTEEDANGMEIVKYAGEGTYVFELYKCMGEGEEAFLAPEDSCPISVYVSDAGAYVVAGEQFSTSVESGDETDDEKLVLCFNINDRKGNPIVKDGELADNPLYDAFAVTKTPVTSAGYVYVEKITFYEEVNGVYVPYVVNVDAVLEIK